MENQLCYITEGRLTKEITIKVNKISCPLSEGLHDVSFSCIHSTGAKIGYMISMPINTAIVV